MQPPDFPYKDDIMSVNPTCLVLIILLFISIILAFKGYLISCVWNCYRYINGRNSSDVLVYVTSNDTTVGVMSLHMEIYTPALYDGFYAFLMLAAFFTVIETYS